MRTRKQDIGFEGGFDSGEPSFLYTPASSLLCAYEIASMLYKFEKYIPIQQIYYLSYLIIVIVNVLITSKVETVINGFPFKNDIGMVRLKIYTMKYINNLH